MDLGYEKSTLSSYDKLRLDCYLAFLGLVHFSFARLFDVYFYEIRIQKERLQFSMRIHGVFAGLNHCPHCFGENYGF